MDKHCCRAKPEHIKDLMAGKKVYVSGECGHLFRVTKKEVMATLEAGVFYSVCFDDDMLTVFERFEQEG